jgi:hypothetical protein
MRGFAGLVLLFSIIFKCLFPVFQAIPLGFYPFQIVLDGGPLQLTYDDDKKLHNKPAKCESCDKNDRIEQLDAMVE